METLHAILNPGISTMIAALRKAYKFAQALSLDVVLGSGALSLAIARYFGVELPLVVVLGLMIAVWFIYTYDHLSDARKVNRHASTYRHRFHQLHFRFLRLALIFAALAGIIMTFFMPLVVITWGLGCVVVVAGYFFLIKLHAFWPKELLVGICYTFGVFLGPLSLAEAPLNVFQLLLIPEILLLALANLILFSYFDSETDKQDGHYSLAIHLGLASSRRLVLALLIAGMSMSIILFFTAALSITRELQALIFSMNLVLLIMLLKNRSFQKHELYRLIGDGIFFIPALLLLWYAR